MAPRELAAWIFASIALTLSVAVAVFVAFTHN